MRDRAWNPHTPMTPFRNNDWDEANPSTWDSHTSTPQYQPETPSGRPFEAPTPGAGWVSTPGASFSEAGTPTEPTSSFAAPSPYLPGTPGGPPMTPGITSYLPGTPGGQPMTPGTGALDPTSPAIGMYISDLYEPWLSALFCIGGLVSAFFSFWRFLVHVSSSPRAYRTFFGTKVISVRQSILWAESSFCYCLLPS
jgi:hypothetical protein